MENASATNYGTLYIVATPIGNLADISERAINSLKSVDTILAEDTRHSRPLLTALGISKPLLSLHAHNESEKSEAIINALKNGQNMALISDAGTPLISDPGYVLVKLARQTGIRVTPIPGPCALITALCAAGVPCDSFLFIGFLPAKQQARLTQLTLLAASEYTSVLYESTHRILACVEDIITIYGHDYEFVLAKELTKTFETFIQASGDKIKAWLLNDLSHVKGEFVIILPVQPVVKSDEDDKKLLSVLLKEVPLKQAVKIASALSSTTKNDLYKLALSLQKK
ncbi:methyltransferase [Legionella beliardensis]|uniref:Ribosomal RNA small subunit methyltransferase I n=1 Tax=Legionella beliardensis TaxID=91822 RepID=A0A378I654_9GAMM|nr:16S rRNA (cytidine(1402)-2'-O)-methyltransferase [Legionella beliardensis]STX30240.1 methyltransferase [Legionella beliardensis]